MSEERFLVTGSAGCIGVWVLRNLVREGVPVTALDLDAKHHRLSLVLSKEEIAHIQFLEGDISDYLTVENAPKRATQIR